MAPVSEAGNGRVRNTTIKQLEPKATTNEYLEAPKERSNRPLLRSIANDGDAPKERTRRGQWYVLHDRLTEFQFRPLRVLSLGASPSLRDAPKERSNRPLLRSLSGAAERLLRVFRLVFAVMDFELDEQLASARPPLCKDLLPYKNEAPKRPGRISLLRSSLLPK